MNSKHGMIPNMKLKSIIKLLVIPLIIILTSCVPSGQLSLPDSAFTRIPATATIAPTLTPTITLTTAPVLSPTALPSPTSTPQVHTIKLGETLGGIAWIYGVSLDALKEMNPDTNPNVMIVGETLLIPVEMLPPANQTPVPTPIQLPLEGLNCVAVVDGGAWCFVWVHNTSTESYENVNVSFNMADQQASQVFSRQATAPLNILLVDEKMPIAIYFPGPIPQPFQKSAQFSSAIPYNPESGRYLNIEINVDSEHSILDGQLLTIRGDFTLNEPASIVSIVAVGLDDQGQLIGLRRWQSSLTNPALQGEFLIELASVSGNIAEYQLFAEAQP
ncbi:MAG: LysM domain-containing protein [Anaerolineaceae bacterium]|nr:LysM domain-containing protein [Anaerolineaceae bacterium]